MKKLYFLAICFSCYLFPLAAIRTDECFSLIDAFRWSPSEIERAMEGYVLTVKADPAELGNKLALAILCVALDSRKDAGPAEHAKKALGYIEDLLRSDPRNDLGLLFAGVARSLEARGSWNPFFQLSEMKKAIASLDQAVETTKGSPREWYVRFMRANTYANTPGGFGKWDEAEEDYRFLVDFVKTHPEREPYLVPANYYRALMKKAEGDEDEARVCLRRALEIERIAPSGSREGILADSLLKKLEKAMK
jgi:tetratricopeptide (TPR) repeat protein